ncbi:MAG TPA: hypothetical protein VFN21_03785 [Acidimicrobiales bacterium]|nr:hypothetical protein [Acidimicrobiales bacterium]
MSNELRWVSSLTERKLHYRDCTHFVDGIEPREATPTEMAELEPCETCLGSAPTVRTDEFTCTSCGLVKRLSQRAGDGLCTDCI